jgi:hypothetical protein
VVNSVENVSAAFNDITIFPFPTPFLLARMMQRTQQLIKMLNISPFEPIVQNNSEISGKLKAAKFGDSSYFSTAGVIASKQHHVVFILGGPGGWLPVSI